jgi:hypothetical protein
MASCEGCKFTVPSDNCNVAHESNEVEQAMNIDELYEKMEETYGDAGVRAVDSTDLTADDLAKGFDHCVDKCANALADELEAMSE